MTVVMIFEFIAGGILGKGLNRMFATFVGGALSVLVNLVARQVGNTFQPSILAAVVFLFCGLATFTRLSPFFARYEYGFMIIRSHLQCHFHLRISRGRLIWICTCTVGDGSFRVRYSYTYQFTHLPSLGGR